jgi:hypothetical protein
MKKLVIFVSILAILTFTAAVALAHDDNKDWRYFHGTYKMIATGNCLHSITGFDGGPTTENPYAPYIPKSDADTWGATTMAVGTWDFYRNGKGYAEIINYPTDFPPGSPYGGWGERARAGLIKYDFVYDINRDVITITLTNHDTQKPAGVLTGSISADRITLIIPTERALANYTESAPPLYWAVCSIARTFIRVSD